MKPLSATVLVNSLAAVAAFDPAASFCDEEASDLCLTSFIWCDGQSPPRCSWPDDVSPQNGKSHNIGVIFRGIKYNISWRLANGNGPVTVEWLSGSSTDDTMKPIWSANSSAIEGSVLFDPASIIDHLWTSNNTMRNIFLGTESTANRIKISQGDKEAWSNQFSVQGKDAGIMAKSMNADFQMEKADMETEWKLGVGIGVGLGVPALVTFASFLVWRATRPAAVKTAD